MLGLDGVNIHAATVAVKADAALDERVDRVVTTESNVLAGLPLGAALAENDVAGDDVLTTEFLHAATLAVAVASILNTSLSFLMSHDCIGVKK